MIDYVLGNVGGVLALYDPPSGQLIKNCFGNFVKPIRATENLEEFKSFVYRYCASYKYYTDYPILEFNNEMTLVFIKPSYDSVTEVKKVRRSKFYAHLTAQEVD